MKKIFLFSLVALFLFSCQNKTEDPGKQLAKLNETQEKYKSFGEKISPEASLSANEMKQTLENLKPGDTINAKFITTVNSVCKMKGCWMTLELPETDEDMMVKFKDYGFFVPKDIEGKEVIVEGLAFVEETSVEDQKHFAEDAGKSPEEIAAITQPKYTRSFLAHGVLLKE